MNKIDNDITIKLTIMIILMIILIRTIIQLIIMTISIIIIIIIIMTIIIMISFCLTELKIFGDWLMASFSLRADNRSLLQDVKTCTYYSHCIVYFTEIFIKINLLDNSSIIHKVQSYTMSFKRLSLLFPPGQFCVKNNFAWNSVNRKTLPWKELN